MGAPTIATSTPVELGRVLGVGHAGEARQARRSRASPRTRASARGGRSRRCNATPAARCARGRSSPACLPLRGCAFRHELRSRRSLAALAPLPARRLDRRRRRAAAARQQDLLRDQRHRRLGRLRRLQQAAQQAPGADRELPHLGLGLPRVDRTLAGRAGAADPPHHHRRQQRRPRADQPRRRSPRATATSTWSASTSCSGRRGCAPTSARWASRTAASTSTPPTTAPATPRDEAHRPRWYKRAFRRIYILVHGGGKRAKIDAELAEAGLPPLNSDVPACPRRRSRCIWSTLPAGSPTVPHNRPRYFYPGDDYVDWVGTDFYSDNQDWKALNGLYKRYTRSPSRCPSGASPAATTRATSNT